MLTQQPHSRVGANNTKKRRRTKCLPQRFYESWIKDNLERFKYPPYIVKSAPRYFVLRFKEVAPEITCRIGKSGTAEVYVRDSSGFYWDIIADFDVVIERDTEGKYFCGLCIRRRYFSSRKEMWERHVFNAMRLWTNKNFGKDRSICLWRIPGAWGAQIIDNREIRQRRRKCVRIFPLLANREGMKT